MIIYEVNLTLDADIYQDYLNWLKPHMKKMLTFNGFLNAELIENKESNGQKYYVSARYYIDNQSALEDYFNHYAKDMRQEGMDLFKNKFSASRNIYNIIEMFNCQKEKNTA